MCPGSQPAMQKTAIALATRRNMSLRFNASVLVKVNMFFHAKLQFRWSSNRLELQST
jgi:hypothetical protein